MKKLKTTKKGETFLAYHLSYWHLEFSLKNHMCPLAPTSKKKICNIKQLNYLGLIL